MCAVAELEAGFISDRTRRALAAAKARGRRLGGNRGVVLTKAARKAGRDAQAARAAARAADLAPVLKELQEAGVASLGGIARALTERGIPTARGSNKWTAMQVARTLARRS
jgi:DNA invertase Pin-like site-specific DNA recombinase